MNGRKIADGTFSSRSIYEFALLFAYIMAFLYKIFSPDLIYVRARNIILGVAVCGFVYLTGTALQNLRAGLLASLVAALYKPLILYSIRSFERNPCRPVLRRRSIPLSGINRHPVQD